METVSRTMPPHDTPAKPPAHRRAPSPASSYPSERALTTPPTALRPKTPSAHALPKPATRHPSPRLRSHSPQFTRPRPPVRCAILVAARLHASQLTSPAPHTPISNPVSTTYPSFSSPPCPPTLIRPPSFRLTVRRLISLLCALFLVSDQHAAAHALSPASDCPSLTSCPLPALVLL